MPASTALNETNRAFVVSAMMRASVVLPVPGGPQRMIDCRQVALDRFAQRLAGREQLLLADELVERARPHALGQRRAVRARCAGVVRRETGRPLIVQLSLPPRFVDDERGGDRGVQRLDGRLHRNRDALVGGVDRARAEARRLRRR